MDNPEDSLSPARKKSLSMDEYKKRKYFSSDQTLQENEEKSDVYSAIMHENEESDTEEAESITWKLLPVRSKRPAILHRKSHYVQQNHQNRAITLIPTEKVPLEKISLNAFRDLPLPPYRSTVVTSSQKSKNTDDDIFADLAEMLNFKNESSNPTEEFFCSYSPVYLENTQHTIDEENSKEVVRKDENWRDYERNSSENDHDYRETPKRKIEDSRGKENDRKRKRHTSAHRYRSSSFNDDRIENLHEMMLRARREHEMNGEHRPRSPPDAPHWNTNYSSRIPRDPPRRRSQHQNNFNQSNRKWTPYARQSSVGRRQKPYYLH